VSMPVDENHPGLRTSQSFGSGQLLFLGLRASTPKKMRIIGHPGQNQHGIRKCDFQMSAFSVPRR
jgi:hypothetical protein